MSFTTPTTPSEDSTAVEQLHTPPQRLEQELKAIAGVEYVAVRPIEDDILLDGITLIQIRGGNLLDIAHVLDESNLGPFDLHHSPSP